MAAAYGEVNFGTIALDKGFVTPAQLGKAVTLQISEDLEGKPHRRLGEILIDLGYMNPEQIQEVLQSLHAHKGQD